jgi:pimeloyl-ACP methyl ester carboxylesterase
VVAAVIVYGITRPPHADYRVTPQSLSSKVAGPILKATEETWRNHDGTTARGWLIKGADGGPAVILLHGYGADRSWVLNLAVKLNESTNFTVLWPDLRGHGENPPVRWSLFGGLDGDDVTAAIEYLKTVKTASGQPQIAPRIGLYGIELGSYAALDAARRNPDVRALALDSLPTSPDDLIRNATDTWSGTKVSAFHWLASAGVRVYGMGKFQSTPSCDLARSLQNVRVMVLCGGGTDAWRTSCLAVAACFTSSVEMKRDLTLTGANLPNSTGEQEEAYDRPVIEFFDKALR